MHLKRISIHRDKFPSDASYPFNVPAIFSTETLSLDSPVILFTGENGSGKSTLLEAIARKCEIYIWGENDNIHSKPNPYAQQLHTAISLDSGRVQSAGFIFRIADVQELY